MIDITKLNDAQRDGLACIVCGRDDRPMIPVRHLNGCQIFQCSEH